MVGPEGPTPCLEFTPPNWDTTGFFLGFFVGFFGRAFSSLFLGTPENDAVHWYVYIRPGHCLLTGSGHITPWLAGTP